MARPKPSAPAGALRYAFRRAKLMTALCSLSQAKSSRPAFLLRHDQLPAATSTSLLESGPSFPASRPHTSLPGQRLLPQLKRQFRLSNAFNGQHPFPAVVDRRQRRDALHSQERRKSSAFLASPRDTNSGLCRSICPASSSRFDPAARRDDAKLPRQRLHHAQAFAAQSNRWTPIWRAASRNCLIPFLSDVTLAGLRLGRVDPDPIIQNYRMARIRASIRSRTPP